MLPALAQIGAEWWVTLTHTVINDTFIVISVPIDVIL